MSSPSYPVPATSQNVGFGAGPLAPAVGTQYGANKGSLPDTFDQSATGGAAKNVNVVQDYPWTLNKTKERKDIPYIRLSEHRNNEGILKRQIAFYTKEAIAGLGSGSSDTLSVYKELWGDNPTGWNYYFPYFSKNQFELKTSEWQQVDSLDKTVGGFTSEIAEAARKFGFEGTEKAIRGIQSGVDLALAAGQAALAYQYPVVGVNDRPKQFAGHNTRSITIEFPLYNTLNATDYQKNRDFYYIFASQNHYAKKNFITGLPPVFYRVYVPGQYFSYASCVTDFTVGNLGNLHYFDDSPSGIAVPDAYQISITLTELLMPSLNQYSRVRTKGDKAAVNIL